MTTQEVEQEILKVLAAETSAASLSEKLFSPEGLFAFLGPTEEDRRLMVQSPLFKQAQRRFRELQFKEAEVFRQKVSDLRASGLDKESAIKVERVKNT